MAARERIAPMTADTPAVTVDALDAALATAAGSLAEDEQRLAVAVFRLLSAGGPATVTAAAAAARIPETPAAQALRSLPAVVWDASHPDSVLPFLRPDTPWDDDVITTFCHYVRHFTGPATAEVWTAGQSGTFVISLADAARLARRHAARFLGIAVA